MKYRHKLEGFDENWSEPVNSQTAVFTNLDPGEYNFIVQVKNENSGWSDNKAQFNFAIAYPLYHKEIEVNIDIDDFKLGVDQGIPCGLILNELISNAYEHTFADQEKGTIEIIVKEEDDNKATLIVADDGRGLPEDFNVRQEDTLGLTLIETLCSQVEGEFTLENTAKGMRFILEFIREEAPLKVPA